MDEKDDVEFLLNYCHALQKDRDARVQDSLNRIASDLGQTYYYDFVYFRDHPEELPQDEMTQCLYYTLENVFAILRHDGVDCNKYYRG